MNPIMRGVHLIRGAVFCNFAMHQNNYHEYSRLIEPDRFYKRN